MIEIFTNLMLFSQFFIIHDVLYYVVNVVEFPY